MTCNSFSGQPFQIQFQPLWFIILSLKMACPALLSDIRAIAGVDTPVFSAFAAMSSLLMALRLDEPGASDLAEWLRAAVEAGVQTLAAYRNGAHSLPARLQEIQQLLASLRMPLMHAIELGLLLQAQVSGALSTFEIVKALGFSYVSSLFSSFLFRVEQEIVAVQMQSAMADGGAWPRLPYWGKLRVQLGSTVECSSVWRDSFWSVRWKKRASVRSLCLSSVIF